MVLLAIATASSSVSYGVTVSTGPKISSCATCESGSTSACVMSGQSCILPSGSADSAAPTSFALDTTTLNTPAGMSVSSASGVSCNCQAVVAELQIQRPVSRSA